MIPFFQGRIENPNIELMKGKDKEVFELKIKELNQKIENDSLFFQEWENYLKSQKEIYTSILNTPNKYFRFLQSKGLFPKFGFNRPYKNILLNMNRCETHHEIMKAILEK